MDYKIKLIKSSFYNETETKNALCAFIQDAKQLSIGTECLAFETEFSAWQGRKYSVLFNSGSSANLALIQALLNMGKLQPGMKVGFSGITWATNVMPLLQLGLIPIPVDIELDTLNVSSHTLEQTHQEQKLDCLFLTNLLGFSDDIKKIKQFCFKENILLLEDNCESMGSKTSGKMLGNFGLASTFSFFVGHHMSAIEGGMVCTDDKELDRHLRMARSHGWDRHLTEKQQKSLRTEHAISDFFAKYTFYDLAYNLRPNEITGFLGKYQLKFIDETTHKREQNFKALLKIYDVCEDVYPLDIRMDFVSNFAMPLVFKSEQLKDSYCSRCEKLGIEVRPIVGGVMADQPFFKKYISQTYNIPVSRLAFKQGFYFANNPELTQDEIEYLIAAFKSE